MTMTLTTRSLFNDREYDMASPICHVCKKVVVGPRLVINERWTCTTCAYYLDQGKTPPGTERDK